MEPATCQISHLVRAIRDCSTLPARTRFTAPFIREWTGASRFS